WSAICAYCSALVGMGFCPPSWSYIKAGRHGGRPAGQNSVLFIKIRVQLQLVKLGVGHGAQLGEGTVGQGQQLVLVRLQVAAHLGQGLDGPLAGAGVVDAQQVGFLKSQSVHIRSPFPRSFWALSFYVRVWAGFSAAPQRTSVFPATPVGAAAAGRC